MLNLLTVLVGAGSDKSRGRRGTRRVANSEEVVQEELGKWIWAAGVEPRNSYVYAHKLFKLDTKPTCAFVKACADSGYQLYVNGAYVGGGPARSTLGLTYYDTYEVTSLLKKGSNVIAFIVHHAGENTYSSAVRAPALLCKVEIDSDHGHRVIFSDETWKVHKASAFTSEGWRLSKGLGFQEVYDSGQRVERWAQINCNERDWQTAVVVGVPPDMPWGRVVPRRTPNLVHETTYPVAMVGTFNTAPMHKEVSVGDVAAIMADSPLTDLSAGSVKHADALLAPRGRTYVRTSGDERGVAIVLDFGKEVCGSLELGIAGCGQGVIDLGYGEYLDHEHVKPNGGEVRYNDRIMLAKGGFEWRSFSPRAFRYLQMEFRRLAKPVAIDYVRVAQALYPTDSAASFECSDPMLNSIWQSGAHTARLCMADALIDSPRLERAQWWGDARIISRTAYYAYGDTKLLAHGLAEFAAAQTQEGMLPALCPAGEQRIVPDFALLWIFSLFDYYVFSGDVSLVRELYSTASRLLSWFAKHRDSDGLLCNVPGEVFIDWAEFPPEGNLTALNCLYYQALRIMAALASIVERKRDAETFAAESNALKLAINRHLRSAKPGFYVKSRVNGRLTEELDPQSNILAALYELADQYERASILRWVLNYSAQHIATPYFASFLLEALYKADRHEEALNYMRQQWGPMVSQPPGTMWEDFTGLGGRCHGWATSPTADLIAEYVGIKPAMMPNRFSIIPHTGGLEWAKGSVVTGTGLLSVSWKKTRNQFVMKLEVPKDVKVDVSPPGGPESTVVVNGRTHAGRFVTLSEGSHQIKVVGPRQPRPQKIRGVGEPAKIPHVEVLGGGIHFPARAAHQTPRCSSSTKKSDDSLLAEALPVEPISQAQQERNPGDQTPEQPDSKRQRARRSSSGKTSSANVARESSEPEDESGAT